MSSHEEGYFRTGTLGGIPHRDQHREQSGPEIGAILKPELIEGTSDLAIAVLTFQRRLRSWKVTNAEDVLAVLNDLGSLRSDLEHMDSRTRAALRSMPPMPEDEKEQ